MAEFVRAQIFGTTFEITSRLGFTSCASWEAGLTIGAGTLIYNQSAWVPSDWSGMAFGIQQ
jgi:hypothetical protein